MSAMLNPYEAPPHIYRQSKELVAGISDMEERLKNVSGTDQWCDLLDQIFDAEADLGRLEKPYSQAVDVASAALESTKNNRITRFIGRIVGH